MSMYECVGCGMEESFFPKIFLAVNTSDPNFPYDRNEFEVEFNNLATPYPEEHYISQRWEKFWSWLGDNKIRWFCSVECAINYLRKESGNEQN